jgi:hypothetical protein
MAAIVSGAALEKTFVASSAGVSPSRRNTAAPATAVTSGG